MKGALESGMQVMDVVDGSDAVVHLVVGFYPSADGGRSNIHCRRQADGTAY